MTLFVSLTVAGISVGVLYGILAISLAFVYRTSGVLNLAQAGLSALSATMFGVLVADLGYRLPVALAITLLIGLGYGLLSFLVVEYAVRDNSPLNQTIALLGLLIGTIAVMAIFDINGRQAAPALFGSQTFKVAAIYVSRHEVVSFFAGLVMAVGLQLLLTKTRLGTAMRAVSESRQGSLYCGISLPTVSLALWLITGLLVAFGGVLLSPLVSPTGPNLVTVLVIALGAAMFGGLINFPQAFAGGVILGIVTSLSTAYVHVLGLRDVIPTLVVLPMMAVAPNGLRLAGFRKLTRTLSGRSTEAVA